MTVIIFLFHLWLWSCAIGLAFCAFIGVVHVISAIVDGPDRSEHHRSTVQLAPWREVKPLMRTRVRLPRAPVNYRR